MVYNPQKIERKWQRVWEEAGIFKTSDKIKGKKNFYHLVMFPYPSGDLHIGHWYNFAPADVYARFKRMQGFNVMSPIGFDAFGLPAENAAIKHGIHPKTWTYKNIERMRKQLKSMGTIYDWQREIITCDPDYYKWTQWLFLQFYKAGLAYRAKVPANWCPSCKTILANEQVIEGKCERCDSDVLQKEIEQWLFKITDYAEKLLKDLDKLDWPERTKTMQKNWIGKSEGYEIKFSSIPVFTTRLDTIFGCTYLVLAPENPIIEKLKNKITNYQEVKRYIEKSKKKTERERLSEAKEKTGVEIKGVKAINPANGEKIPIWMADYVLIGYGTGAIMAVPDRDERDMEFAKKYNLPIKKTRLVDSKKIAKKVKGKKITNYKLRDWVISRQRYWGVPIPMVKCQKCGWVPVREKDLPVLLPTLKDFRPTGKGKSPLAKSKKFVQTKCPKCKELAERETDTMDTFVCSSWYYLRYTDPKNKKKFADPKKLKAWLPVDMYIGGAEHTVMHLLYARFFTKALQKLGILDFSEPFLRLRHQGIILGPDGQKMSKSRGNVIDPDIQVKKYGADAVRMYLCFMGPYDQGGPWQPRGIVGIARFLDKIFNFQFSIFNDQNSKLKKLLHRTIKKVTEDIENFRFNTAISALMILVNEMQKQKGLEPEVRPTLLKLLAPFAPHFAEELWSSFAKASEDKHFDIKNSVHNQKWPKYNPKLIKEEMITLIIQVNGKVRAKTETEAGISKEKAKELALSCEKVRKWTEGKKIKKIIFVPDKLINIVI